MPRALTLNSDGTVTCYSCKQAYPRTPEYWYKGHSRQLETRCKRCNNKAAAERKKALRLSVLTHYSGGANPHCACCGESTLEFLAIDHIDGGGTTHRRAEKLTGGTPFYCWLRKHGYPIGYRVLCHNCNQAHGYYGYCPHSQPHTPHLSPAQLSDILARVEAAERALA